MKKRYYIPIVILILLIVTNPTYKDFENHIPTRNKQQIEDHVKLHNYFVASTYEENGSINNTYYSAKYLGILGNFFVLDKSMTTVDPLILKRDTTVEKN